jgi:hypothetical protein
VFDALNHVSEQHKAAFKSVFSKGGQVADANAQIAELHFDVNEISKELRLLPAPLFSMGSYPEPSSPSYWEREIELVKARKESGLAVWQVVSDLSLTKQLLTECASCKPRVVSFVQDVMSLAASSHPHIPPATFLQRPLHSCRIKNPKR